MVLHALQYRASTYSFALPMKAPFFFRSALCASLAVVAIVIGGCAGNPQTEAVRDYTRTETLLAGTWVSEHNNNQYIAFSPSPTTASRGATRGHDFYDYYRVRNANSLSRTLDVQFTGVSDDKRRFDSMRIEFAEGFNWIRVKKGNETALYRRNTNRRSGPVIGDIPSRNYAYGTGSRWWPVSPRPELIPGPVVPKQ